MEQIGLVVGDWSGDGHRETETIYVESSLSAKELEKAFVAGSSKLGIDITSFCEDYEDDKVPLEVIVKLEKTFPDLKKIMKINGVVKQKDEFDVRMDADTFAYIYMLTAEHGNPKLKWKIVEPRSITINIGGYGLFYN